MNLLQVVTSFVKMKKAVTLAGILLLFLAFLVGAVPAQAANSISAQLEEQILQVIRQHPEVIIESVEAYQVQQQQEQQQARQAFLDEIKTNPQTIIGGSPTTGATDPRVVLVEFSDFQCPFCGQAHDTVREFMDKYGDEVMLVYKHFPLASIHPEAIPAAKAAWAAYNQGRFWEYHDALFAQQDRLGEELYLAIADDLGLDIELFNRDRSFADPAIENDMQLGTGVGVSGTPFFVMNGQTFAGAIPLEQLEQILASVS